MTGRSSSRNRSLKKTRRRLPLPLWIALAGLAALATALLVDFDIGGRKVDFTPKVQGAAAVAVDNEKIDYGDIRLGTPVKTEFRVTNIGSEVLRFSKTPYVEVKEGC